MSLKDYVIHPIPLMKHEMPTARMVSHTSYGEIFNNVNYIWYIEGISQNVIIDTGMDTEVNIAYGYKSETIQTVEEGLDKVGLGTDDIDVVISTHLHVDHMYFARKFRKASIIVQRKELEFALNPHPMFATAFPEEVIKGHSYEVVDGDTKFEDGISLILTPGHTPGGQSVAINTTSGLVVITGYCCIQDNFEPVPTAIHQWGPPGAMKRPFTIPGMHINPLEAYDSMVKVMRIADLVVPIHEEKTMLKTTIP